MSEPTQASKQVGPPQAKSADAGRRRLLQGGLSAAPLLMTVVSRPALGGGSNGSRCYSPSGFVSMPTSEHGQPQFCTGRTPGFWKQSQKFNEWPYPYLPVAKNGKPATKFSDVFTPVGPYAGKTLLEVLGLMG